MTRKQSDESQATAVAVIKSQLDRVQIDVTNQGRSNEANFAEIKARLETKYVTKEEIESLRDKIDRVAAIQNWILAAFGTAAIGIIVYTISRVFVTK